MAIIMKYTIGLINNIRNGTNMYLQQLTIYCVPIMPPGWARPRYGQILQANN